MNCTRQGAALDRVRCNPFPPQRVCLCRRARNAQSNVASFCRYELKRSQVVAPPKNFYGARQFFREKNFLRAARIVRARKFFSRHARKKIFARANCVKILRIQFFIHTL